MTQSFFHSPVILDKHVHEKIALPTQVKYTFAKATHLVPLAHFELFHACKSLPVLFIHDAKSATPVALVGAENENYLVNKNGSWTSGKYIPHIIRAHPFGVTKLENNKEVFVIDMQQRSKETQEVTLFESDKPTQKASEIFKFVQTVYKGLGENLDFYAPLVSEKLLTPVEMTVTKKDGTHKVTGISIVDEGKISKLNSKTIAKMVKSGLMSSITAHRISLSNQL